MIFNYKNRLSAILMVNTLSSDMILKNLRKRVFIENLDDLDIKMIVKYFKKSVDREGFTGVCLNLNLKDIRDIEDKFSKESYEYDSVIKLNDNCKCKSHNELESLFQDLRNSARYYADLEGLKDYLGVWNNELYLFIKQEPWHLV